jgi:hypothetical protein
MGFKYKKILFLTALVGLITSATAQITEGSEVFGGGSLGELLVGFIDAITLVSIDSTPAAAIFVALTAVFYFAEKNMFEQIFLRLEELIVDAMGRGSTGIHGTDEFPTGVKGMALATAFITSNMLAGWLGIGVLWLIMPIAVIGLLIVLVVKGKIFASVLPTESAASATRSALGTAKDYLDNAGNEAQDAAETGNEQEGLDAENKIQEAHEILNNAEGNIAKDFEQDREELERAIEEFNDVFKYKKEEDQDLRSEDVQTAMDNARANLQVFMEALEDGNVRSAKDNLDEAVKDFQYLVKIFTHVDEDLEQEIPEEKDALNNVIDAADRALESHKDIQVLVKSLKEAEKEDEYLEKLAESRGFKEMYQRAEQEEEEEKKLEEKLEKLEMEDGKLLKELKEADKILQEHIKMDDEILKTLNREVNQYSVFGEDNLVNAINKAMNFIKENAGDEQFWKDAEEDLKKCKRGMKALKDHAEHIQEIKQNEDRKEKKVADNLEKHIKEMTN